MPSFDTSVVLLGATVLALLIPFAALQRCPACRHLALRTLRPTHRCPSRHHTKLARRWVGFVLLLTGAAVISRALLH